MVGQVIPGVSADLDWWSLIKDPAFIRDPHSTLARLRDAGSIHRDKGSGVFFVLGHEAFSQMVRNSSLGRDTRHWTDGWNRPGGAEQDPLTHRLYSECTPQMINADPPDHGRMRGVYAPTFRSAQVATLEPMIKAEAQRLVAAMPEAGVVDMIGALAAPLPLRITNNLFDVPPEMDAQIAAWSHALVRALDVMLTPATKQAALAALDGFKAFLRDHLDTLRSCPHMIRGPLADTLAAEGDGRLDEDETLTNLVSMLVAGHETTVSLIGSGILLLLERPADLAMLKRRRGLMRTAVEEFLRICPSTTMVLRVARAQCEIEGVCIPAGALLIGLIDAVNRDPAQFPRPDVLELDRHPNAHYGFGGGIHVCIGAPLARLEARIAFDALLDRYPVLDLDGPARWHPEGVSQRGLQHLPVRVRR